jgi:hypothetical protein
VKTLLWLAGVMLVAGLTVAQQPNPKAAPANSLNLRHAPMPAWFKFETKETVNDWIAQGNTQAMTEHAWLLLAAVTSPTNQQLNGKPAPVFETWWSRDETLSAPQAKVAARRFEAPRQLTFAGRPKPARAPATFFSDVKYNEPIRAHIRKNRYYDPATLQKLNAGWPADAPLSQRKLNDFPDTSIMLKPVYQSVSGTEVTILPYWTNAANSTKPAAPGAETWTKSVAVVPPGAKPDNLPVGTPVVPLSSFYTIKLTVDELQAAIAATGNKSLKEGDFAILVGMHVASREIDDWTWQTFYWSPEKQSIPPKAAARIIAPFDQFQVAIGYSYLTNPSDANSKPIICFNPYLEAGLTPDRFSKPGNSGLQSNCITCHRGAAWPPSTAKFMANGVTDPKDPFCFTGNTKTDFMWGIVFGVSSPK